MFFSCLYIKYYLTRGYRWPILVGMSENVYQIASAQVRENLTTSSLVAMAGSRDRQQELRIEDPESIWKEKAECRGENPDIFFDPPSEEKAKSICRQCPVWVDCLEWALSTDQEGTLGGLSAPERSSLLELFHSPDLPSYVNTQILALEHHDRGSWDLILGLALHSQQYTLFSAPTVRRKQFPDLNSPPKNELHLSPLPRLQGPNHGSSQNLPLEF